MPLRVRGNPIDDPARAISPALTAAAGGVMLGLAVPVPPQPAKARTGTSLKAHAVMRRSLISVFSEKPCWLTFVAGPLTPIFLGLGRRGSVLDAARSLPGGAARLYVQ